MFIPPRWGTTPRESSARRRASNGHSHWPAGAWAGSWCSSRPSASSLTRVVLLEPSPPGELQGFDPEIPLEAGTFDGPTTYGAFPVGFRSRPESALALAERKQGISVPQLKCPSLVVHGSDFAAERGQDIAAFYGSDTLTFTGLDHWDLVHVPEVRTAVAGWLTKI